LIYAESVAQQSQIELRRASIASNIATELTK
jgi:hypothetical protein